MVAAGVAVVAPKVKSGRAGADVVVVETAVPVTDGAEVGVAASLGCSKLNRNVAPVVVVGLNKDNDGVEDAPKEKVVFLAVGCSSIAVLPPAADVRGPLKEKGAAVLVQVSAGMTKVNKPAGTALGGWLNDTFGAVEASVDTGRGGLVYTPPVGSCVSFEF